MDLNVLSKLSPTTDVKKAGGGPGPEDNDFDTVFQDADKLRDSPKQDSSKAKPGAGSDDNPELLLADPGAVEPAQEQAKEPATPKSPADVQGSDAAGITSGNTNPDLHSPQPESKTVPQADAPGTGVFGLPATAFNSNVATAALFVPESPQQVADSALSASRIVTTTPSAQGSGIPPGSQAKQMGTLSSTQSGAVENQAGDIATRNSAFWPGSGLKTAANGTSPIDATTTAAAPTPAKSAVSRFAGISAAASQTMVNGPGISMTGNATPSADVSRDPTNAAGIPAIDLRANSTSPMTLVERHLGGHPVTLTAFGSQEALPGKGFKIGGWGEAGSPGATAPGLNSTTGLPGAAGAQPTPVPSAPGKTSGMEIFATLNAVRDVNAGTLEGDLPQEAVWDPRPGAVSSLTAANPSVPRADLAASVARQIADAMRSAGDKPVEIALNPVELGRVRMILSASDAGVAMNILADRPETLDLMRRNIDDLAKTFAELGYEDISFSFGHNDQAQKNLQRQHDNSGEQTAIHGTTPDNTATADPPTPRPATAPNGIDMRL